MANVVKKYSMPSKLAQKMVDKAVARARELDVRENELCLTWTEGTEKQAMRTN